MIKKCEICGNDMILKTVGKKNAKNYGELIKPHKNKRFCSSQCQIEWQRKVKWEDRIGEEAANRIRIDTSERVSGDKNPTHNPDVAKKVSESLKLYLKDNPRFGEKNSFFGREHTEEYKKLASETRKGKWAYNDEQKRKQEENTPRGKDSHLWKGGISFDPYSPSFNNHLKKKIKIRDNYTCICGKKTQKLAVHHIDYNKENCNDNNLISLCYSCHSKTNHNRDHWEIFFIGLIKEKYDIITDNEVGIIFEKNN